MPAPPRSARVRRLGAAVTLALRVLAGMAVVTAWLAPPLVSASSKPDRDLYVEAQRALATLRATPKRQARREEWEAVVLKFRRVLARFPQSAYCDDALLNVGHLYRDMAAKFRSRRYEEDAITAYQTIVREYASSSKGEDALYAVYEIARARDRKSADTAGRAYLETYPGGAKAVLVKQQLTEARNASRTRASEPALPKAPPAGTLTVFNLRFWSGESSTRVVLDVDKRVPTRSDRLDNPDRLWIDLLGTRLHPNLHTKAFPVGDGLLEQVRIAQNREDAVRVVLEFKDVTDHSMFWLENPTRLVIDVRGAETPAAPGVLVAQASPAATPTPVPAPPPRPSATPSPSPSPVRVAQAPFASPTPRVPSQATPLPAPANPVPTPPVSPVPSRATPLPRSPEPARGIVVPPGSAAPPAVAVAQATPAPEPSPMRIPSRQVGVAPPPDAPSPSPTPPTRTTHTIDLGPSATRSPSPSPTPAVRIATRATPSPAPPHADDRVKEAASRTVPESPLPPRENRNGSYSIARQLGLGARRIVIDPGHGGHDPGSIGPRGLQEKDLTLDVALRLEKLIRKELGAEVILTRSTDVFIPLEERTAIANSKKADLFLSIHANSSRNPKARGTETYFLSFAQDSHAEAVAARENAISAATMKDLQNLVRAITLNSKIDESRDFAASVQDGMIENFRRVDPGVPNRGVRTAPFYVLIGANMPSVLAEIAFVSNPDDEKKLKTDQHRQLIADSLFDGLERYLSGLNRTPSRQQLTRKQQGSTVARGARR